MSDMREYFEKELLKTGCKKETLDKYESGEYINKSVRYAYYWFLTGVTYMCNDIKKII